MVHVVFVSDNFSSYGLFVWMAVKSSIIGAISHLRSVAVVIKSSKDLKWDWHFVHRYCLKFFWNIYAP